MHVCALRTCLVRSRWLAYGAAEVGHVSETDPAETVGSGRPASERFDDDVAELESTLPARSKAEREGLPAGYRMRADAHYVDALLSKRTEREAAKARRGADAAEVRTDLDDGRDARDRHARVLTQLSEDLATIDSVTGVLAADTSRVARRANIDVIRAQTWRAGWMLRANTIVDGAHRQHIRPRPLGHVLGQVRTAFAPEGRLTGVALEVHASDWEAIVAIDESSVITAVTGGLLVTLGLVGQVEGTVVKVAAIAGAGELRAVEISQDDVSVRSQVLRFFDAGWTDRPGGWTAALGARVAKVVAELHGGEAVLVVGDPSGSILRLTFSRPPVESPLKN